ncbi:MAG: helix-turn-helix transcriptional regulator [Peptoniphilaceae bacterium]|nr:helix-turn-helix transcriptional regulator [Peptoniphilaceae bacterium]
MRESNEFKQESLALKLDINRATISMYERDKRVPSTEILKKYSDIFDVYIIIYLKIIQVTPIKTMLRSTCMEKSRLVYLLKQ